MIPYGAKRMVIKNGKPRASGDDPVTETVRGLMQ